MLWFFKNPRDEQVGVHGWLLVFAAGQVYSILTLSGVLWRLLGALHGTALIEAERDSFRWAFTLFTVLGIAATVAAALAGLALLIKRSPMTPEFYRWLLVLTAVFEFVLVIGAPPLHASSSPAAARHGAASFERTSWMSIAAALGWYAYWMKSTRVARTFRAGARSDLHPEP